MLYQHWLYIHNYKLLLIHSVDPQSQPVVITVFIYRSHFSTQFSRKNSDRYWQDCGFGRGDH